MAGELERLFQLILQPQQTNLGAGSSQVFGLALDRLAALSDASTQSLQVSPSTYGVARYGEAVWGRYDDLLCRGLAGVPRT